MIKSDIGIRKYCEADKPFLTSTWLRNYKFSSYFAKRIRHHIFFKGHQAIVDHLIQKPSVTIFVAHPKEDEDTILGYLACEQGDRPITHFVFVKDAFRNLGIAKELFNHANIDVSRGVFTHWTFVVDEFTRRWPDMIYDPYGL